MITQTQLSEILGVHQTTISGVVNNRADVRVSPETKRRILNAVKKYGYKPSLQAQILRQGKSGLVGVWNFVGQGPISTEKRIRTVRALQESGFRPIGNEVFDLSHAVESLELLIDLKVEGLILKSVPHSIAKQFREVLQGAGLPAVSIDGVPFPGIPRIHSNKALGMEALTIALIEQGYRRLALLPRWSEEQEMSPVRKFSHPHEMIRGFEMAVAKNRDRLEQVEIIRRVLPKPDLSIGKDFSYGRMLMEQIIAERKELPQVLLCNDDEWALGAISACFDAGLRVPHDIAIAGFDNIQAGQFSPIPLTTVSQPTGEMAEKAVEILRRLIAGEKDLPESIAVEPCEVILRKSTGRIAADALVSRGGAEDF